MSLSFFATWFQAVCCCSYVRILSLLLTEVNERARRRAARGSRPKLTKKLVKDFSILGNVAELLNKSLDSSSALFSRSMSGISNSLSSVGNRSQSSVSEGGGSVSIDCCDDDKASPLQTDLISSGSSARLFENYKLPWNGNIPSNSQKSLLYGQGRTSSGSGGSMLGPSMRQKSTGTLTPSFKIVRVLPTSSSNSVMLIERSSDVGLTEDHGEPGPENDHALDELPPGNVLPKPAASRMMSAVSDSKVVLCRESILEEGERSVGDDDREDEKSDEEQEDRDREGSAIGRHFPDVL